MPWEPITTNDVQDEFTQFEQALLNKIQGNDPAKPGPLARILTKVIKKVRGQIKAGGNQVDQGGLTIPDALVDDVIAIARWKWINSVPELKTMQTDGRKKAAAEAEARLKNIASQEPDRERVELPANTDTTPVAIPSPSVGPPKYNHFKRREEDGVV